MNIEEFLEKYSINYKDIEKIPYEDILELIDTLVEDQLFFYSLKLNDLLFQIYLTYVSPDDCDVRPLYGVQYCIDFLKDIKNNEPSLWKLFHKTYENSKKDTLDTIIHTDEEKEKRKYLETITLEDLINDDFIKEIFKNRQEVFDEEYCYNTRLI